MVLVRSSKSTIPTTYNLTFNRSTYIVKNYKTQTSLEHFFIQNAGKGVAQR